MERPRLASDQYGPRFEEGFEAEHTELPADARLLAIATSEERLGAFIDLVREGVLKE